MRAALSLARRGLGQVWPNPAVGCVLVKDGRVIARGWTQPGGRPHAETEALARAGEAARGATAYVTLEPCCHWGRTPPCTDAFLAAGIARAVVALRDPDPRVDGQGLARLAAGGVAVETGLLAAEAAEVNAGFLLRIAEARPLVTLKLATSLDGRIATHSGESRWITGEPARRLAHALRAHHDAVMVGSGTVLADNPELTVRVPGMVAPRAGDEAAAAAGPVRIVADGRLRTPLTSRLVATAAAQPTWLVTIEGADATRRRAFEDCGVEVLAVAAGEDGMPDLAAALRALGGRGLTRVMVEGGSHLAAALLRADLVDRLAWFHAPLVIGGDGKPAAQPFGVDRLVQGRRFLRRSVQAAGEDLLVSYARDRRAVG